MCSANLTSIALSTDAPLCTWFPQLAQKIPPYRVMSEADDVSLLLSPKDSDEDGDDFGTPEGEFACRLSAACSRTASMAGVVELIHAEMAHPESQIIIPILFLGSPGKRALQSIGIWEF